VRPTVVLTAWLHSGWRDILKLAALVAAAALTTVVGLVVTGIWQDITGDHEHALGLRIDASTPQQGTEAAVVPVRLSRLPPPPEARIAGRRASCPTRDWVRGVGGADTQTIFTVYVEGLSDRTVILDRAEVEVVRRRPPMRGTWVGCVGAARTGVRTLSVDLDSRPARAVYTNDAGDPKRTKFLFSLRRREVEVFSVVAPGGNCWCSWRLRLGYTVRNQRHTVTVDDAGRPFETTGSSRAVGAQYSNGWRRLPPG
jgi:hypothetical protein